MKKRLLIGILVLLAAGSTAAFVFPAARQQVLGRLRHEATFEGKPTSYWAYLVKRGPALDSGSRDAGKALREGGAAALPVLCEMLQDPDAEVRAQALITLSLMDAEKNEAIPALLTALQKEYDATCLRMTNDLLLQADRKTALAALSEAMEKNPDYHGLAWATNMVVSLTTGKKEALDSPETKEAANTLRRALDDSSIQVRVAAARGFWKITKQPDPVVPVFADGIQSLDQEVGNQALHGLQELGAQAKPALPHLLEALHNPDFGVRIRAVQGLADLGPQPEALQPLLAATQDADSWGVREAAIKSLEKYSVTEVTPAFLAALKDEVDNVRIAAARALGRLKVKEACPNLMAIVKDKDADGDVRVASVVALAQIGLDSKEAVPLFITSLKDDYPTLRVAAANALMKMGPAAKDAVPALQDMAKDENAQLRAVANRALKAIEPEAAKDKAQ